MKDCYIIMVTDPVTLMVDHVFTASEGPHEISRIFDKKIYSVVVHAQEETFHEALIAAVKVYNADTNLEALRKRFLIAAPPPYDPTKVVRALSPSEIPVRIAFDRIPQLEPDIDVVLDPEND